MRPTNESISPLFTNPLPPEGTLYEYNYDYKGMGKWIHWPKFILKEEPNINSLGVQITTIDTARYSHLLKLHIKVNEINNLLK